MVLESLESETPNIKDLSLEISEKRPELLFDPEKELDRDFIQSVLQHIEEDKDYFSDEYFKKFEHYDLYLLDTARNAATELACIKVLLPKRVSELNIDNNTSKFLSILKNRDETDSSDDVYMSQMAYLRMLLPGQVVTKGYQELKINIKSILENADRGSFADALNIAYYSKLLMIDIPDGIMSENHWENHITYLHSEMKLHPEDPRYVIRDLARMKVVNPERFAQIELTEKDWEKLINYYHTNRDYEVGIHEYSEWKLKTTLELAIITADEVIIDEKGLHLKNKSDDQSQGESLPPLPEQRSF